MSVGVPDIADGMVLSIDRIAFLVKNFLQISNLHTECKKRTHESFDTENYVNIRIQDEICEYEFHENVCIHVNRAPLMTL